MTIPRLLLFSIICQGSLSVWTIYNSLSCHCHALSCIFFCVLMHFFVLVLLIITNFLLSYFNEIKIKVVNIYFLRFLKKNFFGLLNIFLLKLFSPHQYILQTKWNKTAWNHILLLQKNTLQMIFYCTGSPHHLITGVIHTLEHFNCHVIKLFLD